MSKKEELPDKYLVLVGGDDQSAVDVIKSLIMELNQTCRWARAWKLAAKVHWRLSTDRAKELNARLDRLEALASRLEGGQ